MSLSPTIRSRTMRPLAKLLGAGLSTWVLAATLRATGAAFASTVAILPLVLLGWFWLVPSSRHGVVLGGRRMDRLLLVGLLGLILASIVEPVAGLPQEVLAVSWAALWIAAALRLLLGARRRLAGSRTALFFLWAPCLLYAALLPHTSEQRAPDGDEPWYLLVTHSLAADFDLDLANNYREGDSLHFMGREIAPQLGDPSGEDGQQYSRHGIVLPILLLPGYALLGKLGAQATMVFLAALLAFAVLALCRRVFPKSDSSSLLAYTVLVLCSPLLVYSSQIWSEVPAALLVTVALHLILDLRHSEGEETSGPPSFRGFLAIVSSLGLLAVLKVRFLLLSAGLAALAVVAGRITRQRLFLVVGLIVTLGGALLLNALVLGDPLGLYGASAVRMAELAPRALALGASGLLFDVAFGLIPHAPLWLLAVVGTVLWLRRAPAMAIGAWLAAAPYLLAVASRQEWFGGWSPPFRYGVVLLPLFTLGLCPLFERRRQFWVAVAISVLGGLSLVFSALYIVEPGWSYNLADGSSRIVDSFESRFRIDLGRILPSSIRPNAATLIVPLLALGASFACLTSRRRRSRSTVPVAALVALLGTVGIGFLASSLPTRVIEVESRAVHKAGGHRHPEQWVIDRQRYREGWALREGEWLAAAIHPGGGAVSIALVVRYVENREAPTTLRVRSTEGFLKELQLDPEAGWQRHDLGTFEWPEGADLELAVPPSQPTGLPLNGFLIDRVELRWRSDRAGSTSGSASAGISSNAVGSETRNEHSVEGR